MPMPRSLPRFWLSRRRALKPFQSAFSIAASMISTNSPESKVSLVGDV